MKTIWKFRIPIDPGRHEIEMPAGAKIISAHVQRDEAAIWAEIDPEAHKTKRVFLVVVTGEDIEETELKYSLRFVATFPIFQSSYVIHVYEDTASRKP